MKQYREKLRLQVRINTVIAILTALFALWAFLGQADLLPFPEPAGSSRFQSFWRGTIFGMLGGTVLGLVLSVVGGRKALKDEKKLKALYIKVHDERTQQIGLYARSAAMSYSLLLGLIAAIAAGFFSMTVSLTIMACVVAEQLLTAMKIQMSE